MLCSPTWPGICYVGSAGLGIHKDPPAFVSPVLGLKCTTTHDRFLILFFLLFKCVCVCVLVPLETSAPLGLETDACKMLSVRTRSQAWVIRGAACTLPALSPK